MKSKLEIVVLVMTVSTSACSSGLKLQALRFDNGSDEQGSGLGIRRFTALNMGSDDSPT